MKKTTFTIALISLFAFTLNAQTLNSKPNDKTSRKVIKTIERLAEAGIERDVKVIDALYAEDYFHTNADGSIMTKADVLKSYQSPSDVKIESNDHDEDKIQLDGDRAIVSTRILYKGSAENQPFSRFYRVTYVLRKKKQWQIVASHASLIMN